LSLAFAEISISSKEKTKYFAIATSYKYDAY